MSSSQSQPQPAASASAAAAAAVAATSATSSSSNPVATSVNTDTMMKMNGNNNNNGQVDKKKSMTSMNMTAAAAAAGNSTKLQTGGTTTTPPKSKQRQRNSIKLQSPPPQFNDDDEEGDIDNLLHHQYSSSASSFASTLAISGGASTDNDTAYITEIARRSVARAALHLGIEGMEGIALDTLGSVLLGYLEMVGTTISTNVEISGRSSAHVNAYDALNAITECTAPAAMQLGISGCGSSSSSSDLSLISTAGPAQLSLPLEEQHHLHQRGWEGLASFLFGPEWFSIRLAGEEEFEMKKKEEAEGSTTAKSGSHAVVAGAARGNGVDGGEIGVSNGSADASSSSSSAPPKKAGGGKTFLPNRPTTLPPISEEKNSTTSVPPPKSGKGKQLPPNMMGNEKTVTFSLDRQNSLGGDGKIDLTASSGGDNNAMSSTDASLAGRWHAPYLHTIPAFPLVKNSKDIANPHRLPGSKITLSLHDYTTEMEACVDYSPVKRPTKKGGGGGGSVVAVVDDHERKRKAAEVRDEMAERAMRAALRIPDDVYSIMGTVWGSMRKEDGSSSIPTSSSINKNVKSQSIMSAAAAATAVFKEKLKSSSKPIPSSLKASEDEKPDSGTTIPTPSYVPNFLPPYPTNHSSNVKKHDSMTASLAAASSVMGNIVSRLREKKRKLSIDITSVDNSREKKKTGVSNRDAVRRSVIGLGKSVGPSYWGSTWLDVNDDEIRDAGANESIENKSISNTGKVLSDMLVEQRTSSSSSSTTAMAAPSKKTDGTVAPLTRASGSRLTKILEGSMNLS